MIDNFIGVFDNALSKEHCEELIKVYEDSVELNYAISRKDMGKEKIYQDNNLVFVSSKTYVKDDIFFDAVQPAVQQFVNLAWISYEEYAKKYGVLTSLASHRFYDSVKIQKTKPSEGYHVWHCEHDERKNGSRLLLVMVYLNDVEEGGETEFITLNRLVKPEIGKVLCFPCNFMFPHKGNIPLSNDKYIVTAFVYPTW